MAVKPRNNEMRTSPCPRCYLCGSKGALLYRGLKDYIFGSASGEWDVRRCANKQCGLLWLDPIPLETDIFKAYQTYYTHPEYDMDRRKVTPRNPVMASLWRTYTMLLRATPIHYARERHNYMYLKGSPPGRLLDVGCGSGARLAELRALGWEVEGQDVDPGAGAVLQRAHGIPVHLGSLEDVRLPDDTFDAITMDQVIEHVHDPIALLAECYRILKPRGTLLVTTPNSESHSLRYFGPCWNGLEVPRHLRLFSGKTLHTVATRAGFRQINTWTTAIHAQWSAHGSLYIQSGGQSGRWHAMSSWAKARLGLWAIGYQLCALIAHHKDKDSGDALILKAEK
jgi:2-polyprenyl-3-methyl-5-hydroxy-6-metoxy-1,4-benzoquinol methylase